MTAMLIIILGSASALFANDADIGSSATEEKIYTDQPANYYWNQQNHNQVVTADKDMYSHATIEETEDQIVVTFHGAEQQEEKQS